MGLLVSEWRDESKLGFVRMGVNEEPRKPCCEESGPETCILILVSEPQGVGALSTREWCPSAEGWVRLAPKTAATPRRARVRKLTALDST